LKDEQIGRVSSASSSTEITAPIVYPKEMTGRNDVRIVSFMMSAEDLLEVCYVLRKDNWEESMWLYQRLIDKKKIKKYVYFWSQKVSLFIILSLLRYQIMFH
jgi:hypothetical protein